ncbi:Na(+)/H(+) exchange regulatory cofactor NHE-RF2 [Vanessa tameamea]|uniref:Na(+)/H(+) exchange regulatory cofactor NHE-RF2 n=1 Tax=Vanessa tameamea TaxID=334116 RepID=A0A8B8IZ29_VANTA
MAANGSAAAESRLCHVRKVPNFDGYGFNLHAEKGKPGQYIGKVDDGSPAETAGLRRGDRILEVNGQSIAGETHKQVVARIKQRPDDAELLVVAPAPGEPVPDLDAPERPASAGSVSAQSANASSPASTNDSSPITDRNESPSSEPPPRLNLQMTAAEMRAQLAAKKKVDPKKVPMDLKSKFDIVKKL